MQCQITAENQTKASRESHCSATAWSSWLQHVRKEPMSFPSSCASSLGLSSHAVPQTLTTNLPNLSLFPLVSLLPLESANTSSFPPKQESFLSPCGSRTPLWGPPADDSIWQPWSHREGAQFAPKQRNIISAKVISTLSETSQSHPPFECKGLAHSSAERGRERKGTAKEKAWGGLGGDTQ